MERIDQYSRAAVEFTLTWNSENASHSEQFWADPVSFWRDVLDPQLIRELMGKSLGDRATAAIPAARFPAPFDAHKRIRVRADQFQGVDSQGNRLVPLPGRFYPQ